MSVVQLAYSPTAPRGASVERAAAGPSRHRMTGFAGLVDAALEVPIAPSFTKIGYLVRRRLFDWPSLDQHRLDGRVIAVTGATSGLGRATAEQLALRRGHGGGARS